MVSRTVNISFPETRQQIAGIFEELDTNNRGEVTLEPAKYEMTIPISQVPGITRDLEISALYNSGRVSKRGGGEGVQIVTIPQDDEFQPLINSCGAIAQEVDPIPGVYHISVPSKRLKEMLDNADEHEQKDFGRALGNYSDEVTLNEVTVMNRWVLFAKIKQISIHEDKVSPQGFIEYIQSGSFEKPSLTSAETEQANAQMMSTIRRAAVGLAVSVFSGVAWVGYTLSQIANKAAEEHNNKLETQMNYGEEDMLEDVDSYEVAEEIEEKGDAVKRLDKQRSQPSQQNSHYR